MLALQRATHATLQALAVALADLHLTASEMNVLANLADRSSKTVSELGADVGSRPTTLTSVLDRLEGRGHVTRRPHAGDRRAVVIALTSSGRRVAAIVRKQFTELETRVLGDLPVETIENLRTALDAFAEATI